MTVYEPLSTTQLTEDNKLLHPQELPELVHEDDPALAVMVDFKRVNPVTIKASETIDNALNEMKISGVHLLIVTNENSQVTGLISSEDLLGEKPIMLMQHRGLARDEIKVRMVMTARKEISVLDIEELRYAKVAHIVETLKKLQQHYTLVVKTEQNTGRQSVVGLFASSQISKQLHSDITTALPLAAHTLAELQKRHT